MPINLDAYLGHLATATKLRSDRSSVLASNIANSDTPNYKARDFDFQAAMGKASGDQMRMAKTSAGHMSVDGTNGVPGTPKMQYRVPNQPSLDGNTVDSQLEKTEFAQNAMMHQATLTFLNGRIRGLMNAIKGE